MAQAPTKEELVKKYGSAFQQIKELSFGVEFPNGDKSILRPLPPKRYKQFMGVLKETMGTLTQIGLPTFDVLDDKGAILESIRGQDVTPAAKPVWELGENGKPKRDESNMKIPVLDDDNMPVMKEFPNVRIELEGDEIRELSRASVKKHSPKEAEIIKALDEVIWGNASQILRILFVDDADRFSNTYIESHLNVPFLKTLLSLVVDMNGLDFIIPFISNFFPLIGLLFGEKDSQKKQTNTTE